jgi:signal transduction histidine kinase
LSSADPVNILLVDDQPAKLLSYEVILGELGERLIKAGSAREALAQLLRHDVAVVLIDVQMPELDGFELAAMIREHPRFQKTALIFVSAIHLSELDRIRGYEAGAVDYVPVPVVPEVLRAKVRVFVDLHRKTRELERLNAELEERVAARTAELAATAAELQRLNEDLELRIEARTRERELALAQLFEAQKIDTIGQLTGGVAHDFNNLLMAIMGSLQVLRRRFPLEETAIRLVDNALKGAERGAALTQRLLAFARRQELRPAAVGLGELVAGMNDLLARAVGPGVRLTQTLATDLPRILIDANQLELALLNLAVNARDAMPDGGELILAAECVEPGAEDLAALNLAPGAYVRLSVTDTGSGMDEGTLKRAAEPFFTTKGVGKGTGLGLSMVQGLAVQSGGAMRLTSAPGQGVRVDLWLPQAPAAVCEAQPRSERMAVIMPQEARRVLIVDDDPLVAAGAAAMLEDLGHTVVHASSGREALALIQAGCEVDLVLSDHAMPEMTGAELARRLRQLRPDLRLVLATGYADLPANVTAELDLPRLAKPFDQDELSRAVAEYAAPRGGPLAAA